MCFGVAHKLMYTSNESSGGSNTDHVLHLQSLTADPDALVGGRRRKHKHLELETLQLIYRIQDCSAHEVYVSSSEPAAHISL